MRTRTALVVSTAIAAVLLTGCGSGDPDAGTAAGPTTSTEAAACPPLPDAPAAGRYVLDDGGVERTALLGLPAGPLDRPALLIVALHGHGGSATDLEAQAHLAERGAAQGAVVVVPDALGSPARWNFDRREDEPDDFAFVSHLVDRLEADLCIDPDRVFVAGSSNGAAFAGLLSCDEPGRFAAVAMVIATVPTDCGAGRAPSALTIRGTADPHVRFEGTPELVAGIAEGSGCGAPPAVEHPVPEVERTRWSGCDDDAEVVLDAVQGGVHRWPTEEGLPAYDATGAVLAFFASHPRPS